MSCENITMTAPNITTATGLHHDDDGDTTEEEDVHEDVHAKSERQSPGAGPDDNKHDGTTKNRTTNDSGKANSHKHRKSDEKAQEDVALSPASSQEKEANDNIKEHDCRSDQHEKQGVPTAARASAAEQVEGKQATTAEEELPLALQQEAKGAHEERTSSLANAPADADTDTDTDTDATADADDVAEDAGAEKEKRKLQPVVRPTTTGTAVTTNEDDGQVDNDDDQHEQNADANVATTATATAIVDSTTPTATSPKMRNNGDRSVEETKEHTAAGASTNIINDSRMATSLAPAATAAAETSLAEKNETFSRDGDVTTTTSSVSAGKSLEERDEEAACSPKHTKDAPATLPATPNTTAATMENARGRKNKTDGTSALGRRRNSVPENVRCDKKRKRTTTKADDDDSDYCGDDDDDYDEDDCDDEDDFYVDDEEEDDDDDEELTTFSASRRGGSKKKSSKRKNTKQNGGFAKKNRKGRNAKKDEDDHDEEEFDEFIPEEDELATSEDEDEHEEEMSTPEKPRARPGRKKGGRPKKSPAEYKRRVLPRRLTEEQEEDVRAEVEVRFAHLLVCEEPLDTNLVYGVSYTDAKTNQFWERDYKELLVFKEVYGHTIVPKLYEPNPSLARFVAANRTMRNKMNRGEPHRLTPSRLRRLAAIDFIWEPKKNKGFWMTQYNTEESFEVWKSMLHRLLEYKKLYGDCLVPKFCPSNQELATWVTRQRHHYRNKKRGKFSSMTDQKERMLMDVGFVFNTKSREIRRRNLYMRYAGKWDELFDQLVDFKKQYGHLNVPKRCTEYPQLACWVQRQRSQMKFKLAGKHNSLTSYRLNKLKEIDFVFCAGRQTKVDDELQDEMAETMNFDENDLKVSRFLQGRFYPSEVKNPVKLPSVERCYLDNEYDPKLQSLISKPMEIPEIVGSSVPAIPSLQQTQATIAVPRSTPPAAVATSVTNDDAAASSPTVAVALTRATKPTKRTKTKRTTAAAFPTKASTAAECQSESDVNDDDSKISNSSASVQIIKRTVPARAKKRNYRYAEGSDNDSVDDFIFALELADREMDAAVAVDDNDDDATADGDAFDEDYDEEAAPKTGTKRKRSSPKTGKKKPAQRKALVATKKKTPTKKSPGPATKGKSKAKLKKAPSSAEKGKLKKPPSQSSIESPDPATSTATTNSRRSTRNSGVPLEWSKKLNFKNVLIVTPPLTTSLDNDVLQEETHVEEAQASSPDAVQSCDTIASVIPKNKKPRAQRGGAKTKRKTSNKSKKQTATGSDDASSVAVAVPAAADEERPADGACDDAIGASTNEGQAPAKTKAKDLQKKENGMTPDAVPEQVASAGPSAGSVPPAAPSSSYKCPHCFSAEANTFVTHYAHVARCSKFAYSNLVS